ncbi:MAG: phosphoglucosamine mutase [Euryarchaeota archaeon]|nr:phosphoglucosamine mutase [Euryarchaeota archaeon]
MFGINMSMFGSSGIRGIVGKEFTIELAEQIGEAVGSMHDRIVLGRDTRTSGPMVAQALISGAAVAGSDTYDAGMVSTPTLARAASSFGCGIMVTASHNPPQYNGVKLWSPDGSAFDTPQMEEVECRLESPRGGRDWRHVGRSYSLEGVEKAHMDSIVDSVGVSTASVVVDCGCGATCRISPLTLREMGCSVLSLNAQPDGFFPGRTPEPTENQLNDLKASVLQREADVGIAHDGDGDRMVAVDERGRFVDGDRLIALFASAMGARGVVAPMDASMVLDEIVGQVERCKVGDVYVAETLKRTGLDFGGEPSGTFIFPRETYCPDGVLAGAMLAKMVSEQSLSERLDELPSFPVARESYRFEAENKAEVLRHLKENMEGLDCDRLLTMDGFRAEYSDGWMLIRLSGTEPKLRTVVEARDDEELERLATIVHDIVGRCLP